MTQTAERSESETVEYRSAVPPRTLEQADALLEAVRGGDMAARNALVELIHPELRRLAATLMANERRTHTLGISGNGLVNLLWLRLLAPKGPGSLSVPREDLGQVRNVYHLFGIAVRNMRRLLVDYSRIRNARKRPHQKDKVEMAELNMLGSEIAALQPDALDIHRALEKLEPVQPLSAQAIELRYFAGLTNEEGAIAMGIPLIAFRRRCEAGLRFLRTEFTASAAPRKDA